MTGSLHDPARYPRHGGLQLLYWENVLRPGNPLNPAINETQRLGGPLVGPAQPAPLPLQSSNYWVQGLTLGYLCPSELSNRAAV
jgi:hypothetical protein